MLATRFIQFAVQRLMFSVQWSMLAVAFAMAETPLEHYLPEDTWVTISIEDLSDLTQAYRDSELPTLLEEDKLGGVLAPLRANPYWSHLSNLTVAGEPLTWDIFLEKYPGRALLAFHGDETTFDNGTKFKFVALADYAGDVDFLIDVSTLDRTEDHPFTINIIEEDYLGTTLYLEELVQGEYARIDSGWTVVDGLFIEASPVAFLKETVDLVLDGTYESSLAGNSLYADAQLEWGKSQVTVFINLAAMLPFLHTALGGEDTELPPNPLGISLRSLFDALALDNLNSLYAGLYYSDDGLRLYYGLLHRGLEGLAGLLAYTEGDVLNPSFVPSDAVSASVSNFSITQAWRHLETVLSAMSPNFESYYEMQLNQLKTNTNIDIRESIVENFGEQFVTLTLMDEDAQVAELIGAHNRALGYDQCFAFEIRDTRSFEMALEGVKDLISGGKRVFESREFMGATIHAPIMNYGAGMQPSVFSYSIHENYFLFATGSANALEPIIIKMEQGGDHLLESDDFQDALAQLPANPNEVQYIEIAHYWKNLVRNLNVVADSMGDTLPLLKLGKASQDVKLPYFYLGGTYQGEDRFSFEALIKKKLDKDD